MIVKIITPNHQTLERIPTKYQFISLLKSGKNWIGMIDLPWEVICDLQDPEKEEHYDLDLTIRMPLSTDESNNESLTL